MQSTLWRPSQSAIIPRAYQTEDFENSFRLWDEGVVGTLTRAWTGAGKTIMACLKIEHWLERGAEHRAMVISYENELVWQFAQEIEDVLGISPAIEMGKEATDGRTPKVIVASRQSLQPATSPTSQQTAKFAEYGIDYLGALPRRKAKTLLRMLDNGTDPEVVADEIVRLNNENIEARDGVWSRVHKFDWRLNWLLVFDEAHKHKYGLKQIRYLVDWFDQNPHSRRNGLTATPKRSDGVSIGDRMFPGISVDYPLFSLHRPCAVSQGYAVPYVQKYISVEGVDFRQIAKVRNDFDEHELGRILGEEGQLAKLVEPLLKMVGDRKTLVFSPTVDMARNVARYINARCETRCECGVVEWKPKMLVGDGAKCQCGRLLTLEDVTKDGEQAQAVWGELPHYQRKEVYRGHKASRFQFLSVCGLCREGYNDPEISCVAIFRPVSKEASSLAEQMKGRGSRPLRGLIEGVESDEERRRLIAESDKPNCLIVDLVGVTGLADCASTAQIYADGLDDEVLQLAEEVLAESEGMDVEEAVTKAQRDVEAERERVRQEREEAEKRAREEFQRRAKADAEVAYTEHEMGTESAYDPTRATEKQHRYMEFLGMRVVGMEITKKQAGRIINMLKLRVPPDRIAYECGISEACWEVVGPSIRQQRKMSGLRMMDTSRLASRLDASEAIDAKSNPAGYRDRMLDDISKAATAQDLTFLAHNLKAARRELRAADYEALRQAGLMRRGQLSAPSNDSF